MKKQPYALIDANTESLVGKSVLHRASYGRKSLSISGLSLQVAMPERVSDIP